MNDYKVTIVGLANTGYVRFEASAPIAEGRTANYDQYPITHMPTTIWSYRNTNGRHFSITGKLVSRNVNEAKANASYLTTIRSWVLPTFGSSGATPPILSLSAYNNSNIKNVPCVLTSYNWAFNEDVDYIWEAPEPMPVIGIVTLDLEEAYSPKQITGGAWAINRPKKSEGSFSRFGTGSAIGSSFNVETNPFAGGENFGGIASTAGIGFPSLGGALTLSPSIIAKLPTMANAITRAATNNPLLGSAAQEAVGLINNRFIFGSNPQQVLNNSSIGTPPFAPTQNPISDAFGRITSALNIPRFGGNSSSGPVTNEG